MRRAAAVAGQFYPGQPQELREDLDGHLEGAGKPRAALACVVPHAGYMYSGHVAGAVYGRLAVPPAVLILGPNHRGIGSPLAIQSAGEWETPLGSVSIDSPLADALKEACPALEEDPAAHRMEHSLEVQVPFLQSLRPDVRIVPIALCVGDYELLKELGTALGSVAASAEPRPLLVSSTDLNHYESEAIGRVKDHKAIEAILALDARRLYDTVRRERISMCGYEPTTVVLMAARLLGAQTAELIRYATSGDITGDRSSVVGYAGILIH
jgi:AmmeMemoRadiSam system protein B